MSWVGRGGLGIREKVGIAVQPLGEECFQENYLRALGNKEKIHTCALESRLAGGAGMEDSGREMRRPLSHSMIYRN